jgi:hypothetical protein
MTRNPVQLVFPAERPVAWRNTLRFFMPGLLTLLMLLSACNRDECVAGQARCDGNVAQFCAGGEHGEGSHWGSTDCGAGFCQLSKDKDGFAFCATTKEPDARCASAMSDGGPANAYQLFEFCQDDEAVGCREGYVDRSINCSTGESFGAQIHATASVGHCESVDNLAFCALDPKPNALCQAAMGDQACDGDKMLNCLEGYVVSRSDCPPTGTCVTNPLAYCTLEKTRAPECPPGNVNVSFCRNGIIEGCTFGWVTYEEPCGQGYTCVPLAGTSDSTCKPL